MKKVIVLAVIAMGLFQACQKEDVIDDSIIDNTVTEDHFSPGELPGLDIGSSALIIDGVPFYAGVGYSPTQDRLFAPAIDEFDMLQSTSIPQPLKVEVEVIRNNEELERYIRKETTRRTGGLIAKIFGFGRSSREVIEERINISESNISVIARISVQSARYIVDGDPFLNSRAQDLIDQGRLNDFIRRHGPGYVDSQVIGGDVYYVYNYDLDKVSIEKKTSFERNIEANVKGWFRLPGGRVLSNDDQREVTNAIERYTVESNIIGFTPNLINSAAQLNGEIQRIQNYVTQNPTNAAAMEMTVASYANIAAYAGFTTEYNKAIKCYEDWEGWSELQSKVAFVVNNTAVSATRQQAQQALNTINTQLTKSRDCNGSVTPNLNQYNGLLATYDVERRNREINAARINRTIQFGAGICLGTTTATFSLLAYQVAGSVPLYRVGRHGSSQFNFYQTSYDPSFEHVEEIAGYVFPQPTTGTINLAIRYTKIFNNTCRYYVVDADVNAPDRVEVIGYVFPPQVAGTYISLVTKLHLLLGRCSFVFL